MSPARQAKVSHRQRGGEMEERARLHLERHGLRLLERNYRLKCGEIDLIMLDGNTVVFVEVKYRRSERRMPATDALDPRKQRKIIITSEHYLQRRKRTQEHFECRFDVVLLIGEAESPRIRWLRGAFRAD